MTNKNPYENDETLDIPDFIEDNNNDSQSVDMSIFKMSDEELYDDNPSDDSDDLLTESKPKKKKNSTVVICMVCICVLLATTVAAIIYAMQQHNAYVDVNTKYQQLQPLVTEKDNEITTLKTQITALEQQLAEKQKEVSNEKTVYVITDGPIRFRSTPNRDGDYTKYNGEEYAWDDEEFEVIQVVTGNDDNSYTWAKIADDVYFCLGTSDDVWASKKD